MLILSRKSANFDISLKRDTKENKAVFKCRPLTITERAIINDMTTYRQGGMQLNTSAKSLFAFKTCVMDWENIQTDSGQLSCKLGVDGVDQSLVELFDIDDISEIADEIIKRSKISGADSKN